MLMVACQQDVWMEATAWQAGLLQRRQPMLWLRVCWRCVAAGRFYKSMRAVCSMCSRVACVYVIQGRSTCMHMYNTISRAAVCHVGPPGVVRGHHRRLTAILLHLLLFCHSQADSPRTFNHTQSRARECRGNLAALGASRKASRKITSVQTSMKTPRNTRILVAANATKGGGWCGTRHRAIAACYLSVPASNRTGDKTLILLMNNAHACLFVHRLRHPHGVERSQRRQDGAADPH